MFFLSHAGTDVASAQALAEGLKAVGLDVWLDKGPRALDPGKPFIAQLEGKIQESQAFLLLVGQRGVDRWVRAEVDVALERQVNDPAYRLVPLLLPGVHFRQLPPFLARFHALTLEGDVTRWERQRFLELAGLIGTATTRLAVSPEACPFLGLEPFKKEEHTRFYFGRDREIREALARLGQVEDKDKGGTYRRWLAVEGASGVGKSSFVRAGLVPAIRGGWVKGAPSRWRVAVMRPGKRPVHQLARALVRAFDWQNVPGKLTEVEKALRSEPTGLRDIVSSKVEEAEGFLLVLDQLEEAFTLTEGGGDETRQLDTLLEQALTSELPFHLLTTLRNDFQGRMGELPHLEEALNAGWTARYLLIQMKPEPLREAILGPAQLAGLTWEGGLPERILQDAQVSSGRLPLVSHVLCELWKRRSAQTLTHATYEELGGVGGALTHSADALLDTFTPEEKAHVRRLLLALVKVGRGARDIRRALTLEEAREVAGGGQTGHEIINRLSGGPAPHLAAEPPAPPRLLTVGKERVDLVHEALLEQWRTLKNWLEESRNALERQDDLEAAARLWKATGALPNEAQLQYLKAVEPVSASARELLEQARNAGLARDLLARLSEKPVQKDPQLYLRLLIEAHRLHPSRQTADALLSWYLRRQRLHLRGRSGSVTAATFSPDGQRILTASHDTTARLWDASTGELLARLREHSGPMWAASFSPDGQRVLTASEDMTARLWDASTGKSLAELRGHSGSVTVATFSPDGQRVLTASMDGTAQLWDASIGMPLAELRGHSGSVSSVTFSPDGQRVLTESEDTTARLWDAFKRTHLARLGGHSESVTVATFSPDGQRVLTASHDTTARLWDASTGELLARLVGHSGPVRAATFSPDGQRVLTASEDTTARLWDASTGKLLAELRGHSDSLNSAAFSPDGRRVVTVSSDGTARLWWVYELCAPTEELFARARALLVRELTEEERQQYLPEHSLTLPA